MDHKQFLKTLPPEDTSRLTRRTDAAGLLHLAGHMTLIVCTALWIGFAAPGWPLAILLLGIALVFLFTLEHEATHQTPFRTTWLNEAVGHLCGAVILLPFGWFRYFHLAHHRFTNDPEKDPELRHPRPETWAGFLFYVSGTSVWAGQIGTLFRLAAGSADDEFLPTKAKRRVVREARLLVLIYALLLASLAYSPLLFWIWIVPLLVGQPFLRVYLLAEHGRCAFVRDMFRNTRTTFTSGVVRFLAWNMPYHAEHHTMPAVPFHRLPELHLLIRPHLVETSDGYASFITEYASDLGPTETQKAGH